MVSSRARSRCNWACRVRTTPSLNCTIAAATSSGRPHPRGNGPNHTEHQSWCRHQRLSPKVPSQLFAARQWVIRAEKLGRRGAQLLGNMLSGELTPQGEMRASHRRAARFARWPTPARRADAYPEGELLGERREVVCIGLARVFRRGRPDFPAHQRAF